MTQKNPQLPWTDEQWDRVQQVIWEEARKARVAASFLPIVGPLPPDTDYVSEDKLGDEDDPSAPPAKRLRVEDTKTKKLATLETRVYLRGPQVADPELTSALQMFRRGANVLARLEDALLFNGSDGASTPAKPKSGHDKLPGIWKLTAGKEEGLHEAAASNLKFLQTVAKDAKGFGNGLVSSISKAIGDLEAQGHFGPFACVLGQDFFSEAQKPNDDSLVTPQDRILPLLGGGPLLRCSALAANTGVVVALGGAPIDLVLARDMTLSFLQINLEPRYVFRIREKLTLRIKQSGAIVGLKD